MKKTDKTSLDQDTMRPEYEFRDGVRGKYVGRYREGTNIVRLDPDVAAAFTSSEAVNEALRSILRSTPPKATKRRRRTA